MDVTLSEAAAALGIGRRRLLTLCREGRVLGARQIGSGPKSPWIIDARADGRPEIVRGSRGPRPTYAGPEEGGS